jgi:hypothetical protein
MTRNVKKIVSSPPTVHATKAELKVTVERVRTISEFRMRGAKNLINSTSIKMIKAEDKILRNRAARSGSMPNIRNGAMRSVQRKFE